jgi:hypothetical protein
MCGYWLHPRHDVAPGRYRPVPLSIRRLSLDRPVHRAGGVERLAVALASTRP